MQYQRFQAISWLLLAAACNGGQTTTLATETDAGTSSTGDATTGGTSTTVTPTTGTPTTSGPTTSGTTTDGTTTDGTTTDGTTTDGTTTDATTGTTTDATTGTTTTEGTTTTGTTGDTTTDGTTAGSTGDTGGDVDNTIYEIQDGTIAEAQPVQVKGVIVTGVNPGFTAFFAQEPPGGQFSGVWVYVGQMGPNIMDLKVGDEVDIAGVTLEFDGLTEIDASKGSVTKTGQVGLPVTPEVLPVATFADPAMLEPWEGVFVRVEGMLAVSSTPGFDEFVVTDVGGEAWVDNLLYNVFADDVNFPQFSVGAQFSAVQGPLNFSFMQYKIAPRVTADLEGYVPSPNPVLGIEDLKPGDLVITEVMYNPACNPEDCEWFEILNKTGSKVQLMGLVVQDSAMNPMQQGKVNVSVELEPGAYAVLGFKSMMTWPYMNPPTAFYGNNPVLGNGGDVVIIKNSKGDIDKTAMWPSKANNGISWKLDPTKLDAVANDDAMNWCYSFKDLEVINNVNEKGTPGALNEPECTVL